MSSRSIALSVALVAAFVSTVATQPPAPGGFSAAKLLMVRSTLDSAIAAGDLPGVVTLVWRKLARFFAHPRVRPARHVRHRLLDSTRRRGELGAPAEA